MNRLIIILVMSILGCQNEVEIAPPSPIAVPAKPAQTVRVSFTRHTSLDALRFQTPSTDGIDSMTYEMMPIPVYFSDMKTKGAGMFRMDAVDGASLSQIRCRVSAKGDLNYARPFREIPLAAGGYNVTLNEEVMGPYFLFSTDKTYFELDCKQGDLLVTRLGFHLKFL